MPAESVIACGHPALEEQVGERHRQAGEHRAGEDAGVVDAEGVLHLR